MKSYFPSLGNVFFLSILCAGFLLAPRMMNIDSDLGRHLTLGEYMLERQEIPTRDILSHSMAGQPRPPYEWLSQVFLALANRFAGLDGVVLVTALVIAIAFTNVFSDAFKRSGLPLTSLAISTLGTIASSLHWLPRPHVGTFLIFSIWLDWLERIRRGEDKPVWHYAMLMLAWSNLHGGFVFGMLAWGAYFTGWAWEAFRRSRNGTPVIIQAGRKWLQIGGFSLLATLVTPALWGNWIAVLNNQSRYILSRTIETMPPDFSHAGSWPFALLLGITLFVIVATRKLLSSSHFILLVGFGMLGVLFARNIPLFAIAATPIVSESARTILQPIKHWQRIETNIARLERSLHGMFWPALVLAGLLFILWNRQTTGEKTWAQFDPRIFPVQAADWLVANPQNGAMFNDLNWGGYLLHRLWPGQRVFLDSQTDFYGEGLVREYQAAIEGDWQDCFDAYEVKWVILDPETTLAVELQKAGWENMYEDQIAMILHRKDK